MGNNRHCGRAMNIEFAVPIPAPLILRQQRSFASLRMPSAPCLRADNSPIWVDPYLPAPARLVPGSQQILGPSQSAEPGPKPARSRPRQRNASNVTNGNRRHRRPQYQIQSEPNRKQQTQPPFVSSSTPKFHSHQQQRVDPNFYHRKPVVLPFTLNGLLAPPSPVTFPLSPTSRTNRPPTPFPFTKRPFDQPIPGTPQDPESLVSLQSTSFTEIKPLAEIPKPIARKLSKEPLSQPPMEAPTMSAYPSNSTNVPAESEVKSNLKGLVQEPSGSAAMTSSGTDHVYSEKEFHEVIMHQKVILELFHKAHNAWDDFEVDPLGAKEIPIGTSFRLSRRPHQLKASWCVYCDPDNLEHFHLQGLYEMIYIFIRGLQRLKRKLDSGQVKLIDQQIDWWWVKQMLRDASITYDDLVDKEMMHGSLEKALERREKLYSDSYGLDDYVDPRRELSAILKATSAKKGESPSLEYIMTYGDCKGNVASAEEGSGLTSARSQTLENLNPQLCSEGDEGITGDFRGVHRQDSFNTKIAKSKQYIINRLKASSAESSPGTAVFSDTEVLSPTLEHATRVVTNDSSTGSTDQTNPHDDSVATTALPDAPPKSSGFSSTRRLELIAGKKYDQLDYEELTQGANTEGARFLRENTLLFDAKEMYLVPTLQPPPIPPRPAHRRKDAMDIGRAKGQSEEKNDVTPVTPQVNNVHDFQPTSRSNAQQFASIQQHWLATGQSSRTRVIKVQTQDPASPALIDLDKLKADTTTPAPPIPAKSPRRRDGGNRHHAQHSDFPEASSSDAARSDSEGSNSSKVSGGTRWTNNDINAEAPLSRANIIKKVTEKISPGLSDDEPLPRSNKGYQHEASQRVETSGFHMPCIRQPSSSSAVNNSYPPTGIYNRMDRSGGAERSYSPDWATLINFDPPASPGHNSRSLASAATTDGNAHCGNNQGNTSYARQPVHYGSLQNMRHATRLDHTQAQFGQEQRFKDQEESKRGRFFRGMFARKASGSRK